MKQSILSFALLVAIAGALAIFFMRRSVPAPVPEPPPVAPASMPFTVEELAAIPPVEPATQTTVVQSAPPPSTTTNSPAQPKVSKSAKKSKPPLQDPLARDALAYVGSDPEAEAYWYAAINDPSLPPHERQDLIEDLNEDGLSDPKHPSPDDLPLIFNRLQLIELLGPFAMDDVNGDAFLEAYKDLLNLAEVAMGGGQPVR